MALLVCQCVFLRRPFLKCYLDLMSQSPGMIFEQIGGSVAKMRCMSSLSLPDNWTTSNSDSIPWKILTKIFSKQNFITIKRTVLLDWMKMWESKVSFKCFVMLASQQFLTSRVAIWTFLKLFGHFLIFIKF